MARTARTAPRVEDAAQHIKDEILRRLHEDPRLTKAQLAVYLGISASGLSKALERVEPLRRHVRRAAKYFNTSVQELTGLTRGQVAKVIPPENDPHKPGLPAGTVLRRNGSGNMAAVRRSPDAVRAGDKAPESGKAAELVQPAWVAHVVQASENPGRFALRAGCELEMVEGEDSPSVPTFLLLGPQGRDPLPHELAVIVTMDGRRLMRRYTTDEVDPDLLVLLPVKAGNGSPLALKRSAVRELRAVLATLATDTLE